MHPHRTPTGLQLSRTARVVSRAFDEALDRAGGSLPVWLILLNLKIGRPGNQRELAAAVGVREATLTHHLNAMDTRGLITRRRDTANRRVHVVELTEEGEAAFLRLRDTAVEFDRRLNAGLSDDDREVLDALLTRLAANVGTGSADDASPPWAGLAERPGSTGRSGGGGMTGPAASGD
ncbi:MarR family winged helix-turn-helix transcriptional regulator [Actinacidiphila acidipaludis]|uniref:MarR family winged helix-turn-helix transcriptional regulator n=1 Tax=Actinacidiphila acidipaludis TaxID=2873382 RepID=A0ABS7Q8M6_9ACTN|nr:MarR family winged helix-turn-helix transcriptional regulator [Streptomyces acidipaludis]MBY8879181.1 MarR family winged helix-turn-helix transcriptional regulator [Streptomyces acidipaludis]